MTTTQTWLGLHRLSAGCYETPCKQFTIVRNPAGWVAYRTDEPISADRYDTLAEAREAVASTLAGTTCRNCAQRVDVDSSGEWYHWRTGSTDCFEDRPETTPYAVPVYVVSQP